MRRVLSSLIVLAILVGMFVCLGAQAFAAPEDIAIFAVADEQLNSDMIARLQEQCSGALLIDVNGFAEGQDQLGYNVVWVEQDPVVMAMDLTSAAQVWPGFAIRQQVGPNAQPVIVVGVGEATTAEEVAAAIANAGSDGTEFTVAVGPGAAAEAVKNQVKLFLVSGETDGAVSDLEQTKLVHVAKADAPVAAVFVNAEGAITAADNMPLPEAADPNVGPVEPQADDPNVGLEVPEQNTEPQPEQTAEPEPEPTEVPRYDVVYKGNGGGNFMEDDFDFQSDLDYYFKQNGYTAPEGKEFAGWMIEGDETGTIYQPNDVYHVERDIVVLAQWKDIPAAEPATDGLTGPGVGLGAGPVASVVTISFDANGGTGTMDPQTVAAGVDNPVPENGFTAPEGKKFDHWYGSDGVDYFVGEPINVQSDVTLAAQWVEAAEESEQTYTATFVPGEDATGNSVSVPVKASEPLTMIAKPDDFAKEGYTFVAWNMNGTSYAVNDTDYIDQDTTITAEWTKNEEFEASSATITFQPGEGIGEAYNDTVDLNGIGPDSRDENGNVLYGVPECTFTAPAGKEFDGWKNEADGQVYMPERVAEGAGVPKQLPLKAGDSITLTAQWKASEQSLGFVVSFSAGVENAEGTMAPVTVTNGKLTLPECAFKAPGLIFAGWNVGAELPVPAGTEIEVTAAMDIKAAWKEGFTVTYKANGGTGDDTTDTAELNEQITLPAAGFTAPSGQEFDVWTIEGGDGTKFAVGSSYTVTGNVTFLANWKALTSQDPGATTTDMLMYTQGGTDEPSLTFANAKIATVSFDNYALTNGTQFALSDDQKTVTITSEFLDTQSAGQHNVAVTFQAGDNGATYAPVNRIMQITAPPAVTPEANPTSRTIQETWNRAGTWFHTFDKAPTKVQIYYGTSNGQPVYQDAKAGTDYTVNGNVLTLLPAMINGNWGGQWPNATYSFRVTLNNDANDVYTLQLKVDGTAAATATATPVPGNNGNVPVTGDETPLVLYVVILLVLIAALAAVIIVVVKRKGSNGGRNGR